MLLVPNKKKALAHPLRSSRTVDVDSRWTLTTCGWLSFPGLFPSIERLFTKDRTTKVEKNIYFEVSCHTYHVVFISYLVRGTESWSSYKAQFLRRVPKMAWHLTLGTTINSVGAHTTMRVAYFFMSLFFSSSGGWVKKAQAPTLPRIRYMSCFDLTHAPVATTARAAATGPVSMSTRADPEGSDTSE